jgi:hypothetical protein
METAMDHRIFAKLMIGILLFLAFYDSEVLALKKKAPPTKTIRGEVVDKTNQPVAGAKVFIRNASKNKTTILTSDESGLFSIYGLDPKIDYIVYAETKPNFGKKTISRYLDRATTSGLVEAIHTKSEICLYSPLGRNRKLGGSVSFKLVADWYANGARKIRAVLLIHGPW